MCKVNKDLLQLYIDGRLDSLEKILLEEHLKECSICQKELNRLKILDWDLTNFTKTIEVPTELQNLRLSTLDQYIREITTQDTIQDETGFGLKEVYNLQYNALKNTVTFIQYLPGNKLIENSGKILRSKLKPNFFAKIIGL